MTEGRPLTPNTTSIGQLVPKHSENDCTTSKQKSPPLDFNRVDCAGMSLAAQKDVSLQRSLESMTSLRSSRNRRTCF